MTSTVYRDRPASSLLPTPERGVRAYLDFVAGVKVFAQQRLTPAVRAEYQRRSASTGRTPATGQETELLLRGSTSRAFLATLLRKSQEMMWEGAARAVAAAGPALRAALEQPVEHARGSLTLDLELDQQLPWYAVEYDFHLQPGAYTRDDLAGPIYEVGAAIYASRADYDNQTERAFALGLPLDQAQPPAAVLELGCGVGKSTRFVAERYLPHGAEVHAIDISAAICRYAHRRLEELGVAVHVRQASSEDLPYADAAFDLVCAKILFHELPADAVRASIREAFRVLRSGGRLAIGDIVPYRFADGFTQMHYDWQVRHNGEPFWRESLSLDYGAIFREVGFVDVTEQPNAHDPSPRAFPWFTIGRKP